MKKKAKEKRKKITKRAAYFIVIIVLAILIVLISRKSDEVIIGKLEFEDTNGDVYIKFDIKNPTDEQKTCLLNITLADKRYKGYLNISAESKKSYKTLVDMPYGKTEVRVDYVCS